MESFLSAIGSKNKVEKPSGDIIQEMKPVDPFLEYLKKNPTLTKDEDQDVGRMKKMIDSHWAYVGGALSVGQDTDQIFTFEQVMKIREHDYRTAAEHFYGHGMEDAKNGFNKQPVQKKTFEEIEELVVKWADEKGIFACSDRKSRFEKVEEEIDELGEALSLGSMTEIIDEAGDVFVTLINLLHPIGLKPEQCLAVAYEKIKNRTGKMVGGKFVKD